MSEKFQAIVIGGGPGGYVCAIRLSQLGIKTACVESRGSLGGTCLNIGCIPSKSLLNLSENFHKVKHFSNLGIEISAVKLNLEKMMKNKDKVVTILTKGIEFLFKKNKVTHYKGTGSFKSATQVSIIDDKKKETIIDSDKIIISTGSEPISLPGVKFDEKVIVSSTGALALSKVPKKMVIVGAGYIGLEMGSVWSRLGSEVHVVEFLDHITPGMDKEISKEFMKILQKQGINFHLQTKVNSIKKNNKRAVVSTTNRDGKKINFECNVVLVSVGRKPNTKNLNLDAIGIALDDKKRVKVDKNFQTNVKNIYAIGDVIAGPMLAHKAEEEGIAIAELIAGQSGHVNYNIIPGVVYTSPEVASIGKTEEQLKDLNQKYKVGKFPFMANSRAKAINETDGFVKILAEEKTDKVLGVHIIGSHAGEMIAQIAIAMEFGSSSEDIARTCHAHPTFSEAIKEAALSVDKRPIHS
jgi:dihydrolipoamide dehydrogenase